MRAMSFRLQQGRSVAQSMVDIARAQIDAAIADVEDPELDRHQTVHRVRRRCKRLRALLRLVRPGLGRTYKREDACFRDAARSLSYVRDAQSLVESLDRLAERDRHCPDADLVAELRARLLARRGQVADGQAGLDQRLDRFLLVMQEARQRVGDWRLSTDGFDAVAGGLSRNYQRARKAMAAAGAKPSGKRLHEWRKASKYHAHHLQLLGPLWTPVLEAERAEAAQLADLLGQHHDLVVFESTLRAEPETFGAPATLAALLRLAERRRGALAHRAQGLGRRVFAESPQALTRRLGAYWQAWQNEASGDQRHQVPARAARAPVKAA